MSAATDILAERIQAAFNCPDNLTVISAASLSEIQGELIRLRSAAHQVLANRLVGLSNFGNIDNCPESRMAVNLLAKASGWDA